MLTTASFLSVLVPTALSPIWSRVYPVDDFTVSALAQILPSILVGWAALAYHRAAHAPKLDADAFALVGVAHSLTVLSCVLLGALCVLGDKWLAAEVLRHPELREFIWISPVILYSTVTSSILDNWMIRKGQLAEMGKCMIWQTAATPLLPALGAISPSSSNFILWGVVFGGIAGVVARLHLSRIRDDWRQLRPGLSKMMEVARRHANFPRDVVPSNVLTSFSVQLPQIAIARFFESDAVGQFARVGTLLTVPYSIGIKPLAATFAQRGGAAFRDTGDCRPEFVTCFRQVLLWVTPFYLVVGLAAPWLYPWFYGSAWADAGLLAQPMALFFWAGAVASPLTEVMNFGRNTKWDVLWQAIRLPVTAAALYLGAKFGDLIHMLWLLAGSNCLVYAIYLALAYRLCRRSR